MPCAHVAGFGSNRVSTRTITSTVPPLTASQLVSSKASGTSWAIGPPSLPPQHSFFQLYASRTSYPPPCPRQERAPPSASIRRAVRPSLIGTPRQTLFPGTAGHLHCHFRCDVDSSLPHLVRRDSLTDDDFGNRPAREECVMNRRSVSVLFCVVVLGGAAWLAGQSGAGARSAGWSEVSPGVWRSPGWPAGYALIDGTRALLVDAPYPPEGLEAKGVRVAEVLLTHHHRDGLAALPAYLKRKVRVRAPKASADYLKPDAVTRYWREALPLRNSRTAYLVVPEGVTEVDCTVEDGTEVTFGDWVLRAVATPGHSFDHVAYLARRKSGGRSVLFAGDALAGPGKLWSPYTTDWDHWTDAGLRPTAASLRKLAALGADIVLPAHGEAVSTGVKGVLERTASAVEEVAFLKSYERYTRERRKDPPKYAFLAKEQPGSNGSLP